MMLRNTKYYDWHTGRACKLTESHEHWGNSWPSVLKPEELCLNQSSDFRRSWESLNNTHQQNYTVINYTLKKERQHVKIAATELVNHTVI